MFETNAQHHYCCSQFQTSRQSGSNYTLPDSLLLTSSRLMGSGMSDTVIVSSLITSTTWLIELIFILRTLRITHDNDAHGSFVPSALQSWMFLSHRSKPAFTKGPFSPSGNHCVGVGSGTRCKDSATVKTERRRYRSRPRRE